MNRKKMKNIGLMIITGLAIGTLGGVLVTFGLSRIPRLVQAAAGAVPLEWLAIFGIANVKR